MEDKTDLHQFQWIINEGLLRDEGVLFGIAGAAIQDKVDAIRDYYQIKKAAGQTRCEQLEKEIEGIVDKLERSGLGSGDGMGTGTETDARTRVGAESMFEAGGRINLVPATLQLFLYGGICYFNFFLETYWLSPVIRSTPICVGLYLFGLFSVFLGRSIMYNSTKSLEDGQKGNEYREKWKIYLEELGVPLVVSLFIAVLPGGAYPLSFSILAALLFFLLFLLGGKGLVNTFFRIGAEAGRYFQLYRGKRRRKMQLAKLRTLRDEQTGVIAGQVGLNGEEEYKIHILTSEYKLAMENRQLAGSLSIKN